MTITSAIECDKCGDLLKTFSTETASETAKENGWDFDEATHYAICDYCDPDD